VPSPITTALLILAGLLFLMGQFGQLLSWLERRDERLRNKEVMRIDMMIGKFRE
jgi:hypothetical protein